MPMAALSAAVLASGPACAATTGATPLDPRLAWAAGAACLLVLAVLALALRRGRDRERAPGTPVLAAGLAVWTLGLAALLGLAATAVLAASAPAAPALAPAVDAVGAPLQVRITAHRWWWEVQYPGLPGAPAVTANELHLPAGRPVRVALHSDDVLHALWIPALGVAAPLVPGETRVLDLPPGAPGRHPGRCAEFCGLQHAHMGLEVVVEPPAAFDAWVARQAEPARTPASTTALRGAAAFAPACGACHAVRGTAARGTNGPDLTHLASRQRLAAGALALDRTTVAAWMLHPQRYKPGTTMPRTTLPAHEVDAIADYLMELQ